jgi:hypothetical protein
MFRIFPRNPAGELPGKRQDEHSVAHSDSDVANWEMASRSFSLRAR